MGLPKGTISIRLLHLPGEVFVLTEAAEIHALGVPAKTAFDKELCASPRASRCRNRYSSSAASPSKGRTDSDLPCNLMLQRQFASYDHSAGLLSFRTLETVSLDGCEFTEVSEELDSTISLPSLLHTRLSYLSVSLSLCSVLIKKPLRDYFRFDEIVENIWRSA
ncbi:hypothetical protein ARMGADRAFT_95819 [Armillaria gallica]|uniref:Uncharacterized protein n=1 Tax=Armillaria gallica TaxID=47427 RepID=A0A2H3CDQ7_ARMGA|nr:hypothetical protein ARMGADRAFT_95819 [Armillaria gallica]